MIEENGAEQKLGRRDDSSKVGQIDFSIPN